MSPIRHKKKLVPAIAHVAAWVCFFTLPYLVFFPGLREFSMSNHTLTFIITTDIFLIIFYYLNTQFLIPRYLVHEKWLPYVLSIIACLLFFVIVPRQIATLIVPPENFTPPPGDPAGKIAMDPERQKLMRARRRSSNNYFNTAIFLLVMTVGTCITVVQRWLATEQHRKETENEKLNTELSFLKSQVNPHFFFNTLNNIYSLAIIRSEKTAPAVMKLSSIMRYILTETERDLVPLSNEVEFIHNYIDLQQVRLTDKVKLDFTITGNIGELLIAPLIFIPFVENAFKYGISTKEQSTIHIQLEAKEQHIYFSATNFIVQSENTMMENTGIGINNVKRRLELLYPGKHSLLTEEKGGYYYVTLHINTES
ncbi:MAG: sensor histidine kinase [Sphingobacteriia bacterium]|nr:sensor histidine kinase [Sphingobacteriia bacterium]